MVCKKFFRDLTYNDFKDLKIPSKLTVRFFFLHQFIRGEGCDFYRLRPILEDKTVEKNHTLSFQEFRCKGTISILRSTMAFHFQQDHPHFRIKRTIYLKKKRTSRDFFCIRDSSRLYPANINTNRKEGKIFRETRD